MSTIGVNPGPGRVTECVAGRPAAAANPAQLDRLPAFKGGGYHRSGSRAWLVSPQNFEQKANLSLREGVLGVSIELVGGLRAVEGFRHEL